MPRQAINGKVADLHLHSHYSDGSDSPARVVERARETPLSAIALTDHDTIAGAQEARQAALLSGLDFLLGTEVSCSFQGKEIHVLVYGFSTSPGPFLTALDQLTNARNLRAEKILARLEEAGAHLEEADARRFTQGRAITRMHIAAALREKGYTKGVQEGFDRFLNFGRPGYVSKELLPVAEALDLAHAAGGLAFLAHPGLSKFTRKNLPRLMDFPFDGLEAYHISHGVDHTRRFLDYAAEKKLLVSGGSDCHGTRKKAPEMGKVHLPWDHYLRIRDRLAHSPGSGVISQ